MTGPHPAANRERRYRDPQTLSPRLRIARGLDNTQRWIHNLLATRASRVIDGGLPIAPHHRVRTDTIDKAGSVTIRYNSRLHHIGLGRLLAGTKVIILAEDLDIRVLTLDGQLLRAHTLDPTRDYQPRGVKKGPQRSPQM